MNTSWERVKVCSLVVDVLSLAVAMEVRAVGVVGSDENAGEPRKVEGAGEAVTVVANSSSTLWCLRSICRLVLESSKVPTMRLKLLVVPMFMVVGAGVVVVARVWRDVMSQMCR